MSLDWVSRKAAIKSAIASALQLNTTTATQLANGSFAHTNEVEWENHRTGFRMTGSVWVDLRLGAVVVVDDDEVRRNTYGDTTVEGTRLLNTYGGRRRFTVTVMVSTDNQEQRDAVGTISAKLRTRIWREDIQAILEAERIGTIRVLSTVNADYAGDGVMYSSAITDIQFSTVEFEGPDVDDVTLTGDFIARVEVIGDDIDPGDHEPVIDVEITTVPV